MSIGYSLILALLWRFFSFGYCHFSGGIFLFFVVFVGGDLCVLLHLLLSSLVLFIFGRAGSLGVSLAGRVIFSFCVGLRCVECRASTIYLGVSPGWVAGLYEFFFSWVLLRWVRYDLFECWPEVGGGAVPVFVFGIICRSCVL